MKTSPGLGFSGGGSTNVDVKRNGAPAAGGSLGGRAVTSACGAGSGLAIGSVPLKPLWLLLGEPGPGAVAGGDEEIGR